MSRYLPIVYFLLGAAALLTIAGLGASGSWRGAWRYMRVWLAVVGGMLVIGLVLGGFLYLILPNPL